MNVLVINGHPRKNSLNTALMNAYLEGGSKTPAQIRVIFVSDLQFNPNVIHSTPHLQELEGDIIQSQASILWADHIVFFYPTWWGTMPALLKGFIDRVFISGFAFDEIEGGNGYAPLLTGKTAQLVTTMDTPPFIYRLLYHSPGVNAMAKATLGFCGFTMIKGYRFGSVRHSSPALRGKWRERMRSEGKKLIQPVLSPSRMVKRKLITWIKALRLQFYPMSFIAYAAGAFGAQSNGYGFDKQIFWIGYLFLFFAEVATVFSNEYYDYNTDRCNKLFGPFTGGSRVLVNKQLGFKEMRAGILVALLLAIGSLALLLSRIEGSSYKTMLICLGFFVLALSYTIPPLKLSYRSLGEITVGITHSFAVIACGYLFQGGNLGDSFPWWLSLPLFLSVLPSIILAGIPDHEADAVAYKKTLAVKLGSKKAVRVALICTVLSAAVLVSFSLTGILPGVFSGILFGVIPHACLLIFLLVKYLGKANTVHRIDVLLVTALTYLMWFAVVPFINLLSR